MGSLISGLGRRSRQSVLCRVAFRSPPTEKGTADVAVAEDPVCQSDSNHVLHLGLPHGAGGTKAQCKNSERSHGSEERYGKVLEFISLFDFFFCAILFSLDFCYEGHLRFHWVVLFF